MMPKILITGAAGRVGTAIRPFLRGNFSLRLFDRSAVPDPTEGEEVIVGDLTSPTDVRKAVEGTVGIVHLACVHGLEIGFEQTLDTNYRAMLYLLEATKGSGITRFVYTSSHHVVGHHRQDLFAGDNALQAPDGFYGLSKAFGESACALYAHRYRIATLVIRVGNADPTVSNERQLRLWVSARDLAQLITLGLTSKLITYDIVYGVSACPQPLFANTRATALGYVPQDDAHDNLASGFLPYDRMPALEGREYVGGPYVMRALPAPWDPS